MSRKDKVTLDGIRNGKEFDLTTRYNDFCQKTDPILEGVDSLFTLNQNKSKSEIEKAVERILARRQKNSMMCYDLSSTNRSSSF